LRTKPDQESQQNYKVFEDLVLARFHAVIRDLGRWEKNHPIYESFHVSSQAHLDTEIAMFKSAISKTFKMATKFGITSRRENPLFWNLRNAFVRMDPQGLYRELKYAFQTYLMRARFPKSVTEMHYRLADLRYPYEWYPATRALQRTIHLHVGPTNSGKTYNALKALESAKTGVYCGPLRLLAHEIFTRFTAKGLPCALLTGEEQRIPDGVDDYFIGCTVEMAPLQKPMDVGVIDEIQMIGDEDRGWAWTQAFLGLQAKELHLCGEERTVDLIKSLCARMGEKCVVHRYKRLNPLQTENESLGGDFKNLQKGDAVVAFSRTSLHELKAGIEQETGRRCAIVYGSLPPETRAQQAALFNDPDNEYDYLVASDAIGMGLNLEIKRVVFETSTKFDGIQHRQLQVSEVKQIGGRAGRFRTANQEIRKSAAQPSAPVSMSSKWGTPGFVTTLDDDDLEPIKAQFDQEAPPLKMAGLKPPPFIVEKFASYFSPATPLSFVLSRLREIIRLGNQFDLCDMTVQLAIAEAIQPYSLSIQDRALFLAAPVSLNDMNVMNLLQEFAQSVQDMKTVHLMDYKALDVEVLEFNPEAGDHHKYLHRLESLHRCITLYLWLSYRQTGVFQQQPLAFHIKELVEEKINTQLDRISYTPEARKLRKEMQKSKAARASRTFSEILGENGEKGMKAAVAAVAAA